MCVCVWERETHTQKERGWELNVNVSKQYFFFVYVGSFTVCHSWAWFFCCPYKSRNCVCARVQHNRHQLRHGGQQSSSTGSSRRTHQGHEHRTREDLQHGPHNSQGARQQRPRGSRGPDGERNSCRRRERFCRRRLGASKRRPLLPSYEHRRDLARKWDLLRHIPATRLVAAGPCNAKHPHFAS